MKSALDLLKPRKAVLEQTKKHADFPAAVLYVEWLPGTQSRKCVDQAGKEFEIPDSVLLSYYRQLPGGKAKKMLKGVFSKFVAAPQAQAVNPDKAKKAEAAEKAKKTPVKKAATKKAPTKKPAAKKASTKKAGAKKAESTKAATKKTAAKKPAAKKATTKKAATKKAAATKPAAKKSTTKKAATKKTASKKPAKK